MIDETYIEMCRKAEEIQDLWEPKHGDLFYEEYSEEDKAFSKEHWPHREDHNGSFHHVSDSLAFMNGSDGRYTKHLKKECIWYPRQEDLQEIAMDSLINKEIEEDFEAKGLGFYWMKREYGFSILDDTFCLWYDGHVNLRDYAKIWLCFVMETCFQKRWDSEKKEWVDINA